MEGMFSVRDGVNNADVVVAFSCALIWLGLAKERCDMTTAQVDDAAPLLADLIHYHIDGWMLPANPSSDGTDGFARILSVKRFHNDRKDLDQGLTSTL